MNRETSRRHGRYIKASDPVRKVVTVTEFSLMEICEKPFTYHDNASANVIHQRLHEVAELHDTIRDSHEIDANFPHENRPVIVPLDFTEEWRRQKRRLANRQQRLEDEEELELENEASLLASLKAARFTPVEAEAYVRTSFLRSSPLTAVQIALAEHFLKAEPQTRSSERQAPPSAFIAEPLMEAQALPAPLRSETHEFVPMAPSAMMPTPALDEEELENLRQAARTEGYQSGFREGEEKGTLHAEQKMQTLSQELSMVIENFEGMQHAVLASVQENFTTICQSLVEAILHKEFTLHPDSFGHIIDRAIKESLAGDECRIFVHPQDFKDLSAAGPQLLKSRLSPDDSLGLHQFRIESKNAIVDARLTDIVRNLLEQADLQLFEPQMKERAS